MTRAWQSLSAVPLQGEKIVRLVYVDEAGISNPVHEPWLVVGAVVVDADKQLVVLEKEIQGLIDQYIPNASRDGFVFHATEIFNGGGKVFKRNDPDWPLEKRLRIADQLAALPKKLNLRLAFGFVERQNMTSIEMFKELTDDKTVAAHATAFITCVMHVELWMRKNAPSEVALLVVEDNPQVKTVLTKLQNKYQDQRLIELLAGKSLANLFPFRQIKQSPLFERKDQSIALQMADFCTYVFKKKLRADPRYERFFIPFFPQIAIQGRGIQEIAASRNLHLR